MVFWESRADINIGIREQPLYEMSKKMIQSFQHSLNEKQPHIREIF